MRLKERQRIYHSKSLLDISFNNKEGAVKISKANLFVHELAKFLISWDLLQQDEVFVTEARFANGKRADVFGLKNCIAHEVVCSETEKSIECKRDEYPCGIEVHEANEIVDKYLKFYLGDKL